MVPQMAVDVVPTALEAETDGVELGNFYNLMETCDGSDGKKPNKSSTKYEKVPASKGFI